MPYSVLRNKKIHERKIHERRLHKVLKNQNDKDFLIHKLSLEWDEMQKSARREELFKKAKSTAKVMAKSILVLGVIAGFVTVVAVAPNIFAAFGKYSRHKNRRGFFQEGEFRQAITYLKHKGYINIQNKKGKYSYDIKLTFHGADVILSKAINELQIKKESKWDGTWHIVMFDIPDKHKWGRDVFRQRLKAMGLYQWQKSVFVFPFCCDEEVAFLASLFNISDYVKIVKTKYISDDSDLREHFSV